MLYYGELDYRFACQPSVDLIELLDILDRDLAPKCDFYLEEAQYVAQQAAR